MGVLEKVVINPHTTCQQVAGIPAPLDHLGNLHDPGELCDVGHLTHTIPKRHVC
jgi:hypothetical protein